MAIREALSASDESTRGSHAHNRNSWWWLPLAAVLLLFADGRQTIALAAWLAPAVLLRFVRTQPAWRGLAIVYLTLVVTRGIAFRGMIPIPGVFYYIFLVISCVSALLPYAADRWLTRFLPARYSTLVFPCTLVVTQFIYSHGPQGSWGTIAYTQAGNLPLLQLLCVTGLWGITFLIGWFAATASLAWEGAREGRRPVAIFSLVMLAVLLGGGARLAIFPPQSPTLRVASLSPNDDRPQLDERLIQAVATGVATAAQRQQFRMASQATENELLARSEHEAAAGAKIVFWSETALYVLKEDESAALDRGRILAQRYGIYLGMALGTWTQGAAHPLENQLVLIDPAGQIAWRYLKSRPTPGPEAAVSVKSDGKLRALDTSFGRMSAAICYDMDFPTLMAQAGSMQAGLVLSPAGDWRAIDPRHTEMAAFRAIEQGFNLVRQTARGLSAAYDYQGHRLAAMDEFHSPDRTLVAEVPLRGVRTFYSVAGDWLAWLCLATLAALVAVPWRLRRMRT